MSNRNPLITQRGIISAGPISFNNKNPDNREITNVSMIGISDSSSSSSADTMSLSKQGQTGYFELAGNSQSFVFSPTNTFGTGSNVLSISDNVATIRNTLILQDGSNKTIFTQSGANMIISGGITFESNTSVDNILVSNITATNVVADSIGATGIVARNITGTNISADSIGATGIVASTIRTNYIGATGIVATNITGTNISANYIGATFLKLQDNASTSTNKPLIWNPDPSLEITTNDVSGTVKTIDLKSYNGTVTNVSTSLTAKYGEVAIGGTLKISQSTALANNSTLTMGSFNLTATNNNASGNIVLNTTAGQVVSNCPMILNNATGPNKRSVTASILYLSEYNGSVANTPSLIYYNDSTILSSRDVATTEYINLTSYNGSVSNIYTTFQCSYNEYVAQGVFKIAQGTNFQNRSTLTMGATDFTIANPVSSGNIKLQAGSGGKIQTASPIAPQTGSDPSSDLNCIGGSNYQWWATASIASTGNVAQNKISMTLAAGVYSLHGTLRVTNSDNLSITFTSVGCGFFTTASVFSTDQANPYFYSNTQIINNTATGITLTTTEAFYSVQCSMVVNLTASTQIFLNYTSGYGGSGVHVARSFMRATRIA